ncbi:MAG TPA: endopeptidase La [Thermotogae bacterium]|nr:ATP-dependent Lon protease [Thermotogota bacterium]HCZ06846.1 endopeptidase La [Thermotogota bacterium]
MPRKLEKLDELAKKNETDDIEIPGQLPTIPTRSSMIIFPNTLTPFYVGRSKSLQALEESAKEYNGLLFVVSQKDITIEEPEPTDLYKVGTVARLVQVMKLPDGNYKVLVEGIVRARWERVVEDEKLFVFEITPLRPKYRYTKVLEALARKVRDMLERYAMLSTKFPQEALIMFQNVTDPDQFADMVASALPLKLEEKQKLLELVHPKDRLELLLQILHKEVELLEIEAELEEKVKESIEHSQKEYYLREKLRAIKEELGGEEDLELREIREKIEKGGYPEYVKEKALHELSRLEKMSPYSPEATVARTYLDWLLNLPWSVTTKDNTDIRHARRVLDGNHYGLDDVKERVLEFLAVRQMSDSLRAPILCLVGPPGVGKTSLGRSIASALGRKFERMSLGGLRDEAEIRGHRRTYVGALPGRIIQLIRRAGTKNPVLLLDEVDKLGVSFQGDPAAALLEVLDPEQNSRFVDHFLEIPFDLSNVLFITTANVTHSIPAALLDRMEVIEIAGYTDSEKLHIAKKFIIPKLLKEHGLSNKQVSITPSAINRVIREYTREAGVRNLDRTLARIMRRCALKILEEKKERIRVSAKDLQEFLGPPRYKAEPKIESPEIGVSTGMAWTPVGGAILQVEVVVVPGKGNFILTGQLGEVMKESAQIAMTLARKFCNREHEFFEKHDFHIHIPEGAVPKDGPSAGITMLSALVSAITGKKVASDVAMTGEISLRGRILPVGGIKEKVLAAYRHGLKEVILPSENKSDVEKIPKEIRDRLKINFVDTVEQVLNKVLID